MSPQAAAVAVIFLVIVANQLVMRSNSWERRPVYLALQALNAALAVGIAVAGVPGFEHAPLYRYALAGVFVFRLVWNHFQVQSALQEARREELEAERERLLDQIQADEKSDEDAR